MMEYHMSQSSKLVGMPIIRFTLISFFIVATVVWLGTRPYVRLYGYAPWIFATSPTPPHSQLIAREILVDRECHIAKIRGYYTTSTSWEEVIAFYQRNGFRGSGFTNQNGFEFLNRDEDILRRFLQKTTVESHIIVNGTDVYDAVRAAILSSQNVYEFHLIYIEDKEGYAECRRRRD
jgi:hypothetical protein